MNLEVVRLEAIDEACARHLPAPQRIATLNPASMATHAHPAALEHFSIVPVRVVRQCTPQNLRAEVTDVGNVGRFPPLKGRQRIFFGEEEVRKPFAGKAKI